MRRANARLLEGPRFKLGEGVVWDSAARLVRWVDIPEGRVFSASLKSGGLGKMTMLIVGGTVGVVAPASGGGLLLGAGRRLAFVDPNGAIGFGPQVIEDPTKRFNDGGCDPAGRFLAGTVTDGRIGDDESLYQFGADGSARTIRTNLHHPNGIAWTADGARLYLVDTVPGDIWRARYNVTTGEVSDWQVAFRVSSGMPDGLTVDSQGNLWIAIWGEGEVRHYSPRGEVLAVVHVDAEYVTSVTLAGSALRSMVITTARSPNGTAGDVEETKSGALFVARAEIPGIASARWGGVGFGPPARRP